MIRDSAESLKRNDLLGMAVRPVKPSDWSTNTGPPYRGPTFTTRNWPNLLADLSPDSATSQTIIWLDTWSEESWRMTSNPHPAIHQPDTKEGQKYIPDLAGITYNQDIAFKINTTRCTDSKCPRHGKLVCINQIRSRTSGRAFNIWQSLQHQRQIELQHRESCLFHPVLQVHETICAPDLQITQTEIHKASTDIQTAIGCQHPARTLQPKWLSRSGQHHYLGPTDSELSNHSPTGWSPARAIRNIVDQQAHLWITTRSQLCTG